MRVCWIPGIVSLEDPWGHVGLLDPWDRWGHEDPGSCTVVMRVRGIR